MKTLLMRKGTFKKGPLSKHDFEVKELKGVQKGTPRVLSSKERGKSSQTKQSTKPEVGTHKV